MLLGLLPNDDYLIVVRIYEYERGQWINTKAIGYF
jgi:hypothetical protein